MGLEIVATPRPLLPATRTSRHRSTNIAVQEPRRVSSARSITVRLVWPSRRAPGRHHRYLLRRRRLRRASRIMLLQKNSKAAVYCSGYAARHRVPLHSSKRTTVRPSAWNEVPNMFAASCLRCSHDHGLRSEGCGRRRPRGWYRRVQAGHH